MRTQKIMSSILLSTCLLLFACPIPADAGIDEEGAESDNINPRIGIVAPRQNLTFYTNGGVDSPDYVICDATATDDSRIVIGSVTIYNSSGSEVHYYEETSSTQNNNSITNVYTSFRTTDPGDYKIEFSFEDTHGNKDTIIRNVTCVQSVGGGDDQT